MLLFVIGRCSVLFSSRLALLDDKNDLIKRVNVHSEYVPNFLVLFGTFIRDSIFLNLLKYVGFSFLSFPNAV